MRVEFWCAPDWLPKRVVFLLNHAITENAEIALTLKEKSWPLKSAKDPQLGFGRLTWGLGTEVWDCVSETAFRHKEDADRRRASRKLANFREVRENWPTFILI